MLSIGKLTFKKGLGRFSQVKFIHLNQLHKMKLGFRGCEIYSADALHRRIDMGHILFLAY